MATVNYTSSTNNANFVLWSFSTAIDLYTDRATGALSLHDRITTISNLGVGVTASNPFTNLV